MTVSNNCRTSLHNAVVAASSAKRSQHPEVQHASKPPPPLGQTRTMQEKPPQWCRLSPQREDSRSCQTSSLLTLLLFLRRRYLPYPPKLEILVTCTRAHHVARRADATKQHARVVGVPDLRDTVQ